jgi:hypothetical protein
MFEILETQNILDGKAEIILVPRDRTRLGELIASRASRASPQGQAGRMEYAT